MELSIVIPVYNTELYLEDCLSSVVNQSKAYQQIIIVNDGSTDNSLEICRRYEMRYSNIVLISQSNQGLSAARNKGLEYVESEYVMFLDSDDSLRRDAVEYISDIVNNENLDILYFDTEIKNELNKEVRNTYDRIGRMSNNVMSGIKYFEACYPDKYVVNVGMVLFKKAYIDKLELRFPVNRLYEDVFFSFKAMIEADKVQYISEKLHIRRYRSGSIMTSEFKLKNWNDWLAGHLECWKYTVSRLKEEKFKRILCIYMIVSYSELKKKLLLVSDIDEYGKRKEFQKLQLLFKEIYEYIDNMDIEEWSFENIRIYLKFIMELDEHEELEMTKIFFEKKLIEKITQKYIECLKNILNKLPFNDEHNQIGIYGTGHHTKQLLLWYERLCGNIKSKIVFIDTYKETNSCSFNGSHIINVKDADKYVNTIVISSYEYEDEMCYILNELYKNNMNTIRFYQYSKIPLLLNLDMQCVNRVVNEEIFV